MPTRPLIRSLLLALSIFSLDSFSDAQTGKQTPSPETIRNTFLKGTDEAKEKLSNKLNLRRSKELGTCSWFQTVQLNYSAFDIAVGAMLVGFPGDFAAQFISIMAFSGILSDIQQEWSLSRFVSFIIEAR